MAISVDVKTGAVSNARGHVPQVFSRGMNVTPGYIRAWCPPNNPMPAIPSQVNVGEFIIQHGYLHAKFGT